MILSYASFFIDHKIVAARVTIGIIPILNAFIGLGNVLHTLPRFSYSAWIIEFMFASAMFNIAAMIEFVVVAYMDKIYAEHRENMKKKDAESAALVRAPSNSDGPEKEENDEESNHRTVINERELESETVREKCRRFWDKLKAAEPQQIDIYTRRIYIGLYALLMIIYFCVPLSHKY